MGPWLATEGLIHKYSSSVAPQLAGLLSVRTGISGARSGAAPINRSTNLRLPIADNYREVIKPAVVQVNRRWRRVDGVKPSHGSLVLQRVWMKSSELCVSHLRLALCTDVCTGRKWLYCLQLCMTTTWFIIFGICSAFSGIIFVNITPAHCHFAIRSFDPRLAGIFT